MTAPLNDTSLFVVSGGGKGITARCAVALAERYHGHFVLLGRSQLQPEPAWAQGATDEAALKRQAMAALLAEGQKPRPADVNRAVRQVLSAREIRRTLADISAAGGQADYASVDVRDAEAVRDALAPYRDRVTALVHGAGLLADKLIARKSADDFEKVYGVKVDGFRHLLDAVDESRLQAVVFFASVAGFYGNVGQADYALANSVLDRTAHLLAHRHPQARVVAVDWGPWDGGMVTPTLKKMLASRGVPLIPLHEGTAALIAALDAPQTPPQVLAGAEMVTPLAPPAGQTYHLHRRLTLAANPYLRDHVIGGHAVLPTVCAAQWMINAAEQLAPGYKFFRIDDYRVFKGIVFDETLAERYTLDLTVDESSEESCRMTAQVRSDLPNGTPRYHYGAKVTLLRALPDAPPFAAPRSPEGAEFTPLAGACLYPHGGDSCPPTDRPLPLFHGPAFRGVEEVLAFTPRALKLRCRLPEVPRAAQGQAAIQTFNPFITDVTLQSLLIWANLTYGYGGLPLRIAGAEQYRPLPFDQELFAEMAVVSAAPQRLVADVTVHDGRVVLTRIYGAEITLSQRLNELFTRHHLAEEQSYD